ncbi:hypothetical protein LMG18102_02065 [Ralstonia mannitolilytica]|uniref:HlyD family efflux transporter periplasmic adaptor subunit n=1 Tax=Ralstonia mannitolilytica TaxID=105219 RepID=UPI0028F68F5C|nr:HlyD family efflux transporter periplasmic adaptor subunit [Ralstonia mannitolilytica]CAJ0695116.1 hypothetical protein LMG18102_02065 [Ralstonia mannitolilytica]
MNLQTLGLKLLRYRDQLTQTIDEVAIGTGISADRLKLIEAGRVEPSGDEILILADHYRCDFKFFISNERVAPFDQTETLYRAHGHEFSKQDRVAVQEFLYLCDTEAFLMEELGRRPVEFPFQPIGGHFKSHGEAAAAALRKAMGHNDRQVPRDIYAEFRSVGVHIFRRKLGNSNISGLFILHPTAGKCVLVDEQRAALQEAQKRLAEVEHEHQAEVYGQLSDKVANEPGLRGDMEKSRELHELKWLKAPVDGWVQKINVTTVGGVVNPAQTLMTIVPDGMPLVVEATLSNDDIGYVKVGQPVELKVDTFPFQKYGTLKGTLVWVSPDAEEKSSASISDENGVGGNQPEKAIQNVKSVKDGYVYKVRIRPERSGFVVDGHPAPIQAGMTVQADIATDRRRVIQFLLSPLVKYLDEAGGVR